MGNMDMTGDSVDAALSHQQVLQAIDAVLGDPHGFVAILLDAKHDNDAVQLLAAKFGLSERQASAVLDQQFWQIVRRRLDLSGSEGGN